MAEYIEREAALAFQNELEPCICKSAHDGNVFSATKDTDIVRYLNAIPAADVVPVRHGRWVELENGDCKCSLCGCYHHTWEAHGYYCQHCGARMDGDGE